MHLKIRTALLLVLVVVLAMTATIALASSEAGGNGSVTWQQRLDAALPLMGHRNWILIVDSAYPLQSSAGIETVETNAEQVAVIRTVISRLEQSIHITPSILMDAELPFVPEQSAPGVTAYRKQVQELFKGREIHSFPHEQVIAKIDDAGKTFHILVLKTTMTIPYTSVFLQLDCKYWNAESEKQLRERMSEAVPK